MCIGGSSKKARTAEVGLCRFYEIAPVLKAIQRTSSLFGSGSAGLGLFDSHPMGMSQRFSDYAVGAIRENSWREQAADANSLFLGYLLLKPKFDLLGESVLKESHKKQIYKFSNTTVMRRFIVEHESEIKEIIGNKVAYEEIPALTDVDVGALVTAFSLLPSETTDINHKNFVQGISQIIAAKMCSREDEEWFDYIVRQRFLKQFAQFVLQSNKKDIEKYVSPFLKNFKHLREAEEIFSAFVSAEDVLGQYEQFWVVWEMFYPEIKELCKSSSLRSHSSRVVHNYLLAWAYWKKDAREWRSLRERDKIFFKKVAEDIGDNPAVLYSLSKLLNEIGRNFVSDGIFWISDIIQKNEWPAEKELEVNTVYYLENLVRGYVLTNRHIVRTTPRLKNAVLLILNFLLERGSVTAYVLREDIL